MFILSKITNTVRIPPSKFDRDFETVLEELLNEKFANKIVLNVGLCIRLYDFDKISDSHVFPGDGASTTTVTFRCVVFRPFVNEVILGRIRSCSSKGITVSLVFFDNILIPPEKLPHPSRFQESDHVWIWDYPTEEGSAELFMEPGSEVRFRVMEERFVDVGPTSAATDLPSPSDDSAAERESPYLIIGSMSEPGLGCLSWWQC